MNGTKILVDTNIILYLLSGDETIAELLNDKIIYISFITEMELLGYKKLSQQEEKNIQLFLKDVTIIDINSSIKIKAIEIRKHFGFKLPDSIIAATAEYLNLPILSGDSIFKALTSVIHLYYQK